MIRTHCESFVTNTRCPIISQIAYTFREFQDDMHEACLELTAEAFSFKSSQEIKPRKPMRLSSYAEVIELNTNGLCNQLQPCLSVSRVNTG